MTRSHRNSALLLAVACLLLAVFAVNAIASAERAGSPAATAKKKKKNAPYQPPLNAQYSGKGSNGGTVTIDVGAVYESGTMNRYKVAKLKWTGVVANCNKYLGDGVFQRGNYKITVYVYPTYSEAAIKKGKWNWNPGYNGAIYLNYKGTFRRTYVKGSVQKFPGYNDVLAEDPTLSDCSYPKLTFDLARN